jgi:hypothetical protein
MGELIEKLTHLFATKYPGCRSELYTRLENHVGGFLIADQFKGKPMEERQREVWSLVRQNLTHDEILSITGIFTQTENEHAIMTEESEAV